MTSVMDAKCGFIGTPVAGPAAREESIEMRGSAEREGDDERKKLRSMLDEAARASRIRA